MESHKHTKECMELGKVAKELAKKHTKLLVDDIKKNVEPAHQSAIHAAVCSSMHAAFLTSRCEKEKHEETMKQIMDLFAALFHAVEAGAFEIQSVQLSKKDIEAVKTLERLEEKAQRETPFSGVH